MIRIKEENQEKMRENTCYRVVSRAHAVDVLLEFQICETNHNL